MASQSPTLHGQLTMTNQTQQTSDLQWTKSSPINHWCLPRSTQPLPHWHTHQPPIHQWILLWSSANSVRHAIASLTLHCNHKSQQHRHTSGSFGNTPQTAHNILQAPRNILRLLQQLPQPDQLPLHFSHTFLCMAMVTQSKQPVFPHTLPAPSHVVPSQITLLENSTI